MHDVIYNRAGSLYKYDIGKQVPIDEKGKHMPHLESIRQDMFGQLFIQLNWGYDDSDFAGIATKKVADIISRLWYADKVFTDGSTIQVWIWGKPNRWAQFGQPLSKRTIQRLIRTINNKMPGIAFWSKKAAAKRSEAKDDHPSRSTRETGATALQHATVS